MTSNSIIYIDQSARRVPLPLNGWQQRISDLPIPILSDEDQQRDLELEGCRAAFIDDKTFVIVLRDGTVYPVEVAVDGKTVSKLSVGAALARTTIPSVLKRLNDNLLFLGSTVGSSLLLRTFRIEEEIINNLVLDSLSTPSVNVGVAMDLDDDDGALSNLFKQLSINVHCRYLWAIGFAGPTLPKWPLRWWRYQKDT
jgi:cleavage and polyadenylation specificity factor subunit 1